MAMTWITVDDANGNTMHALSPNSDAEKGVMAWVFVDKDSGFGWPVGVVQFDNKLKKLKNGNYGH